MPAPYPGDACACSAQHGFLCRPGSCGKHCSAPAAVALWPRSCPQHPGAFPPAVSCKQFSPRICFMRGDQKEAAVGLSAASKKCLQWPFLGRPRKWTGRGVPGDILGKRCTNMLHPHGNTWGLPWQAGNCQAKCLRQHGKILMPLSLSQWDDAMSKCPRLEKTVPF